MLIIQPIGGLCNRMRAINSAYHLAALRKEKLTVIWFCNQELGCSFLDLFKKNPQIRLISIHSKWDVRKVFLQLTSQFINNETIREHKNASGLHPSFIASLRKRCYIATEEQFYPAESYELFQPVTPLLEKIQVITTQYTSRTVGVHIRRTDNQPAIGTSSTDAFTTAMHEELSAHPDTTFYLATDDAAEEATLCQLFPGKILINSNKELSRSSLTGMQDALIDLYCLASTHKIIGSFYSSFTDIAADMYHIPKVIAGKN